MADMTGLATLGLGDPPTRLDRPVHDGRYLLLGHSACGSSAVIRPGAGDADLLMAAIPLDRDLPARLEALLRLWRVLTGHPPRRPARDLTPARSQRLVQALRAVDARAAGATRREIAEALFGADVVPQGIAFDDHHLKSRTGRLIHDGLAMVAGGYRKLLRPQPH